MAPQATAATSLSNEVSPQPLPSIGAAFAGGFYAGLLLDDGVQYALILSPKAGELQGAWNATRDSVPGTESFVNGQANTVAMAEAGSQLAATAMALTINGFSDWYIPARDELELLYRHFKPTDDANYAYEDGANEHSVPAGEEYSEDSPAQTALEAFHAGATDALPPRWHWSSTQYAPHPGLAWNQYFYDGNQLITLKSAEGRARAVRRLPIQSFSHSSAEAAQQDALQPATEAAAA